MLSVVGALLEGAELVASAGVVATFSEVTGQDVEFPEVALDFFYHSQVYQLINDGVSVMHCMSDVYLAEELGQEYTEKTVPNGNDS